MATSFRVDSLSRCLHNAELPKDVNMATWELSKSKIMRRYLFHLAFENQNTNDYITEKLWLALQSGTIPVYLGASNIDEHFFPNHSFIKVDDFASTIELAQYLNKVANNETLYNSYHAWRKAPLPKAFLDKYQPVSGKNNCRLCRWAHARKYGLGWNHKQQVIKATTLPREMCVDNEVGLIRYPAEESWWEMRDERLVPMKINSSSSNNSSILCALDGKVVTAPIDGELRRSVWSRDGTTDILLQGQTSNGIVLCLEFPMKQHEPLRQLNTHTSWIQNDVSRISIVVVDNDGNGATHLVSCVEAGIVSIKMDSTLHSLRLRIIIEDYDRFHVGADQQQTYYGQIMEEDVRSHPQLFAFKKGVDLSEGSIILQSIKDEGYFT